jgi:hypothetical protein
MSNQLGTGRWDDLRVIAAARQGGGTVPTMAVYRNGIYQWSFSNATQNELHGSMQLPHTWKTGSKIYPHIHWSHNIASPGAGDAVFKLGYSWSSPNVAFPASATISAQFTPGGAAQYVHKLAELGADGIAGTGQTVSSVLLFRIYRDVADAADTFPDPIFLHELDFHFQAQTASGTVNRNTSP